MKIFVTLFFVLSLMQNLYCQGWVSIPTIYEDDFTSIHFYNSGLGMIVGGNGTILKVENGEVNPNAYTINGVNYLYSVFLASSSTIYLTHSGENVYKTTDGCQSWMSQIIDIEHDIKFLSFFDENNGYAAGGYEYMEVWPPPYGEVYHVDAGVFKTNDGGENWIELAIPDTTIPITGISFPNIDTGYLVCGGYLGTSILKTTNGGEIWEQIELLNGWTGWAQSVYFINSSIGFVSGYGGHILKTIDGGVNWTDHSYQYSVLLSSIHFANDSTGYIVGSSGIILKTIDSGENWVLQESGTNRTLKSVFCLNPDTVFVVGEEGVILKTISGGYTGIKPQSLREELFKVYPNPIKSTCTIELIKKPKGHVSIIDVFGNEVLTHEITDSKTVLDLNNIPTGLYFLNYFNDKTLITRKIIKH